MANLNLPQVAPNQNQKEVTINDGFAQLDSALTERLAVDLSTADAALTADQWTRNWFFECAGHTVARNVVLPATKRPAVVKNSGTGAITLQVTGGGSAVVQAGQTVMIYNDGANLTVSGGSASLAFTDLSDTFANYAGQGGRLLRVKTDASGIEAVTNFPDAPKAADFPLTFNRNGSVIDTVEGLVFDAGSPGTGDVAGAVCKPVPAGEFQVDANIIIGRGSYGNWAGIGVGIYGAGSYYFAGPRLDNGYSIAGHKNNNAGGHVDLTNVESYGRGILGGWIGVRRFKPSAGSLLVGVDLAVQATNCVYTGWTARQSKNLAGASGCLSTTTGLAPSTGINITVTSSVSSSQALTVLPINSVDGSTPPDLRSTDSDASAWSSVDVPIPVDTQVGDAMVIGIRHQYGVLFDKARDWTIQGNYNGINSDGSSLCVSKVLTAGDVAAGHVTFRSTQLGNGCWFTAIVKAGTYSSIGVSMINFVGGTSYGMSSDNVQLLYSTDRYWLQVINLNTWGAYFTAEPTHVGFCSWFNRTAGPVSLICKAWKQSW